MFQENLVVWKSTLCMSYSADFMVVSGELSSMEIYMAAFSPSASEATVSGELSSMEMRSGLASALRFCSFQENLVV